MAQKLPDLPNLRTIAIGNKEAKRFSCGLVALKGELATRLLNQIEHKHLSVATLFSPKTDILTELEIQSSHVQSGAPSKKQGCLSQETSAINIPSAWYEKPHQKRLKYFIPEWDDLVDPDYDFLNDRHSSGVGDWSNEVYAHQMYREPNYDGILISKIVAERTVKKKRRVSDLGLHRFLRVPDEFPIMGDSGAFGYLMEEVPPYTTPEILEYYTRLGFNFGVSLDHLIFSGSPQEQKRRYDLTVNNAEEFLIEHSKLGLKWEPIGAVQGWDAKSYTEATRQVVAMGYTYIGLGGLVRTKTEEIIQILQEVHAVIPPTVSIHLFGVARLNALQDFADLGVRSVDSASYLRRAWMGASDNYYTLDGEAYAAIRIPNADRSYRAKEIVTQKRATLEQVVQLEEACMEALRAFGRGELSVEATLDVLDEFDHLITEKRRVMRLHYQATLEARPWESCPCDICRKDGIEVIIFRGNNRNRRRGFHNTYVFYRQLQRLLADDTEESDRRLLARQLSLSPLT